jgi:inner membrane protein
VSGRRSIRELASANLSAPAIAVCLLLLLVFDWVSERTGPSFLPGGPLDEVAHLLTAVLLLQALPSRARARIALPALVASVAIDADHIPQYVGHDFMTVGTSRPYTHSLLTVMVLLGLALVARRRRDLMLGLALGVALHFFRDLAEGSGAGIPLLWPLSDGSLAFPHATYVALMLCVAAADACLAAFSSRARPATP